MTIATVGLLHPGAMGAAVGRVLIDAGHAVLWASEGRSAESAARARRAGL
jgi:3-hydroxyisobutyrate dehydrogenase-like beta-hydroxyacid dehydrogenase